MSNAATTIRLLKMACAIILSLSINQSLLAQDLERWFQIEVSIFSNESLTDRSEEQWQATRIELDYPGRIRRLDRLIDLLLIADLQVEAPAATDLNEEIVASPEEDVATTEEIIMAVGPQPASAASEFRFFDFDRDSYLQLPPSASDFQQTNRALERSAEHRLLFHGLWRQVVVGEDDAIPIYIEGGLQYGQQHELQGSLTIRFNDNQDRVVVDANLWLTEFSAAADPEADWSLPSIPDSLNDGQDAGASDQPGPTYYINRVFHLLQSRDMRSTEFHYLDHPALGLVILVEPYEVPPIPLPGLDFEVDR